MSNTEISVLVMGAAGDLGHRIVNVLLDAGLGQNVHAAARGGVSGKHVKILDGFALRGATIVGADLNHTDSLKEAVEGIDVVISAVQGGPETIVDGQLKLLDASVAAGVKRFVPSDFAENLFAIPEGINPYLDWRRTFDSHVDPSGIGYTHILNGGFMEAVFTSPGLIDGKAGILTYWGEGDVRLDFSALNDVAAFVVNVVLDPSTMNKTMEFAGDRLTVEEIAADYEAVTGLKLRLTRRGSIEDGYAELERMKAAGAHPMAMLPMQYLLPMFSGEGRLPAIANSTYPSLKPMTLRSFFAARVAAGQTIGIAEW